MYNKKMEILFIALSILSAISYNQTIDFNVFLNSLNNDDNQIISNENIKDYDELETYIKTYNKVNPHYNTSFFHYENLLNDLNNEYPDYNWVLKESRNVKNASRNIPINMNGSIYNEKEIKDAVHQSAIDSEYGGCGPIAITGILDYFSRFYNFNNIINNPNVSTQRIELAKNVFDNSKVFSFNFEGEDYT